MKTVFKYVSGMVMSIVEILVGVLLIIDPIAFTSGTIIALGAILMFASVICIFKYFHADIEEAMPNQMLFKGLILLTSGSFFVFGNSYLVEKFELLNAFYGVVILLIGLYKVQKTVDTLRLQKEKWQYSAVSALITVVCAAVILFNPFSEKAIWIFIGISFIVEAIIDAVAVLFGDKDNVDPDNADEEPPTEE